MGAYLEVDVYEHTVCMSHVSRTKCKVPCPTCMFDAGSAYVRLHLAANALMKQTVVPLARWTTDFSAFSLRISYDFPSAAYKTNSCCMLSSPKKMIWWVYRQQQKKLSWFISVTEKNVTHADKSHDNLKLLSEVAIIDTVTTICFPSIKFCTVSRNA